MKKSLTLFVFICLAAITHAQSKIDSINLNAISKNFEKTNALIEKLAIKIDSIDIKNEKRNKTFIDSIANLNKNIQTLKADSTILQVSLFNLKKTDSLHMREATMGKTIKEEIEKIIQQLPNLNSGSYPEIIKTIYNVHQIAPLQKIEVLDNFYRLSKNIATVKEYLATKPFDSLQNSNYLDSLNASKQEANSLNFKILEQEIDIYIDLLEMYCFKTKEVGKAIKESVGKVNDLNRPITLLNQKRKTTGFGFLLNEIKKAQKNLNYVFIFKACSE
jgi:hypothetical protein